MTYTKQQLVDALVREYEFLCHDDFDSDLDASPEEYRMMMEEMSMEDLIEETNTDDNFSLEEYMSVYG